MARSILLIADALSRTEKSTDLCLNLGMNRRLLNRFPNNAAQGLEPSPCGMWAPVRTC